MRPPPRDLDARIRRFERRCWAIGVIFFVASLLAGGWQPGQVFPGYLWGYIYWLGLTLGGMAVLMIHYLVGGSWGLVSRRILEATACTLPLMILLFLPILPGIPTLYPWARPEAGAVATHLALYLNSPFFVGRSAFYFVCWSACIYYLVRWSRAGDQNPSPVYLRRRERLSGGGLVLYALTSYFASVDWILSMEPGWSSTIYGMIVMASQGLSAFALSICVLVLLADEPAYGGLVTPARLGDLGNLLLTSVMLWAYVSFSQYLIMWSENLPREISWFVRRTSPGWRDVGLILVLLHFAVPFILLLFRRVKRTPVLIGSVALGLLVLRLVDDFWRIIPPFEPEGLVLHGLYLLAPIGIGGLWLALFLNRLRRHSLLPLHDPDFESLLVEARSHE